LSLVDIVRIRRGQTEIDTGPNKFLYPDRSRFMFRCYPLVNLLVSIARHRIIPSWKDDLPSRNIQCSPFGAIKKKDVDFHVKVCPIYDLSLPDTTSTNPFLDPDCLPEIDFHVRWMGATSNRSLSKSKPMRK
ncbi:hypothetical protein PHMEG_0005697, partial [Phytophthora megakarya]